MPKGCDVSIIENVWGFCKDVLYNRRTELKNKADVYRIGREAFFSEDATNFIKKLYRSLKPRVNKLHKKKGLRVNFD